VFTGLLPSSTGYNIIKIIPRKIRWVGHVAAEKLQERPSEDVGKKTSASMGRGRGFWTK
jgi:hypothetical protein